MSLNIRFKENKLPIKKRKENKEDTPESLDTRRAEENPILYSILFLFFNKMSWFFSSAPTADEPPAPTSTTSLGALGLGAAASVAHNPAAQRAATEFAEDEGVQEAASSFASDQRVQRAFFKTVGVPTAYLPGTEGSSSSSSSTTTTTSSSSSASSSLPQSTSLPPASNSSTSTSRRPSAAALASNIGTSTSRRPSAAALAAAAAFQDSQESQQSHRHTNTNTSSSSVPHEKGGGQLQHQHQRQRRRPPLSSTFIAHPDYGKKRQSTHSDNEKLSSSPPPSPPPPAPLYMLDPFPNSNIPESFRQQFRLYTFVGTHEQEQISQQNQHVDKQSLDYLLTQLYHEHVKESHSSSGSQWNQEQIQEGLHLESLLSDYMNMNDRSYNRTTYSNDEDNEYVQSDQQSQLASLMYQRIQLQAKEDEMRQREYLYN